MHTQRANKRQFSAGVGEGDGGERERMPKK